MADAKDLHKTVQLTDSELQEAVGKVHDGRFGEKFDDEIHVKSVIWVTVSIAIVMVLGFLGGWWVLVWQTGEIEAAATPLSPVVVQDAPDRRLPSGPRLQASPEEELKEMRKEMSEKLHGYGWVDEAAGTLHVPVERAIDLVLERGLPQAGSLSSSSTDVEAPAGESETP